MSDGAHEMVSTAEEARLPAISVAVCTRDRGWRIASTISAILNSDHHDFELVVIDQSEDDQTVEALRPFAPDHRMRIFRSSERGLGRARNTALQCARADVVAFTDDDVLVPKNWLSEMEKIFAERINVAVAFCNVIAAPHDRSAGSIPTYTRVGSVEVSSVWGKNGARGIGAGLAVRRSMVEILGGFDPLLGAGGRFSSCEDGDIAMRALLAGRSVFETDSVAVVHEGFRTWAEFVQLTKRDWYGIGAAYAKPIRAHRFPALWVVAYEGIWRALVLPMAPLLRLRRPQGFKRAWFFWRGFFDGMRAPMDHSALLFRDFHGTVDARAISKN